MSTYPQIDNKSLIVAHSSPAAPNDLFLSWTVVPCPPDTLGEPFRLHLYFQWVAKEDSDKLWHPSPLPHLKLIKVFFFWRIVSEVSKLANYSSNKNIKYKADQTTSLRLIKIYSKIKLSKFLIHFLVCSASLFSLFLVKMLESWF